MFYCLKSFEDASGFFENEEQLDLSVTQPPELNPEKPTANSKGICKMFKLEQHFPTYLGYSDTHWC